MKNVELRYIKKLNPPATSGKGFVKIEKVLQYRQVVRIEKDYGGLAGWKKCTFSDWEDVPFVEDCK